MQKMTPSIHTHRKTVFRLPARAQRFLVWGLTWLLVSQTLGSPPTAKPRPLGSKKPAPARRTSAAKPSPSFSAQTLNAFPVTTVSAASYEPGPVAPDSIVSSFGTSLAIRTEVIQSLPLPTTLGATTIKIIDSTGAEYPAPLFFVAATQINFLMPAATAPGTATVEVRAGDGKLSRGTVEIARTAPGLFTANQDGSGAVAANLLRVQADGTQIYEALTELDPSTGRLQTRAIQFGPENEQLFLLLYLTGLRGAADPNGDGNANETVQLLLGGNAYVPLYAGRQPNYVGLDQVNSPPLPRSLAGRGRVNLALAIPGAATSNLGELEFAPLPGTNPPQVTSLSGTSVTAGQSLTVQGSGFAPTPANNLVRIGGVEAAITAASFNQLTLQVPVGVRAGWVTVRTAGGEGQSPTRVAVTTSVSGIVETTTRQPLSGVTVTLRGANRSATTNVEGAFVLPEVTPGTVLLDVAASPASGITGAPQLVLRHDVVAARDNPLLQPIALQPAALNSLPIAAAGVSTPARLVAQAEPAPAANGQAEAVRAQGVSFDVPVGTRATFADGSNSGSLSLSVLTAARTPMSLPIGYASRTIAQLTPFGTHLDGGGKLTFPNPEGYAPGSTVQLWYGEQRPNTANLGRFTAVGVATVSSDGQQIETPDGVITETGYYFVAAARPMTTLYGHVIEADGTPVRGAIVQTQGQTSVTDGAGGFLLRQAAGQEGERVTVDVTYARAQGRIEHTERASVTLHVNGLTAVAPDIVLPAANSPRPPLLLAPASVQATAGQVTEVALSAQARGNNPSVQVTVTGAPFATIIARPNNAFTLRLTPALTDVKEYDLTLTATDTTNASTTATLRVTVLPAAPVLTDFNPKTACSGSTIVLTGTSLKPGIANPVVSFVGSEGRRLQALVTSAAANQVQVTVPNGATSGTIELTTELGSQTRSSTSFVAAPSQDFALVPAPSTATAVQGTTATYVVQLTSQSQCSTADLTQLVTLSVEGLPSGVKASFQPSTITAGATATLSLVLAGNVSAGTFPFTLKGQATVDGNTVERTTSLSLAVQATGQTTLAGRVLSTKDEPVVGATVSLDGKSATTDAAGAFQLTGISAGVDRPVMVNGGTASAPNRRYPLINEPVTILAGQANVVPYTFYLPIIAVANEQPVIPTQTTIITTPEVQGLALTIPANAKLNNRDGSPVIRVSLSCVEIDRTPAPLPATVSTSMVYTAQPGGARPAPGVVIPVTYPNLSGEPRYDAQGRVRQIPLYAFDHDTAQWYVYGQGTVSLDGRTIVPNPGVGLRDFSWHFPLLGGGGNLGGGGPEGGRWPPDGPPDENDSGGGDDGGGPPDNPPDDSDQPEPPDCPDNACGNNSCTPVNLSTGIKTEIATDFRFTGARGGLQWQRIYTTSLATSCDNCPLGRGTSHNFDVRINKVTDAQNRTTALYLVRPWDVRGMLFSPDAQGVYRTTSRVQLLGDEIRLVGAQYEYRTKRGRVLRFDAASGRLQSLTDRNGNTTTLLYTGNNLTQITDAVQRSIRLEYTNNRITKVTDPLQRVWQYNYDAGGRLQTVTDPLQFNVAYTYDTFSRLLTITDRRQNVRKRITYDDNGRVSRQDFPDGGFEQYAYTLSGQIVTGVTITDALGRTRSKRFNAAGYTIAHTDALGQTAQFKRNMVTNLLEEVAGPCGCTESQRTYDERGNVRTLTDRRGQTTQWEYEPTFNRVTKVTDARGNTTTLTYDASGNLRTRQDALGRSTTYTYDSQGQLRSVDDPLQHRTTWDYDTRGYRTLRTDALGNTAAYQYDAIGRLTQMTDGEGRGTKFTYDAKNRVVAVTDAAQLTTQFTYDENGNRRKLINPQNKEWRYEYDSKNRLVSQTDPLGNTTQYRYNRRGELTAALSPSGRITRYQYDVRGQVTQMTDPLGGIVTYSYDNVGNLVALRDPRGNTTTFQYDELYRLVGQRDPVGRTTTYQYDPTGNLTQKIDRLNRPTQFQYDALDRLVKAIYVDAIVNYQYDEAYRLTRLTDVQGDIARFIQRDYDNANRLLAETTPEGKVSYTYNKANQRASLAVADRPAVKYQYDPAGRLATIAQTLNQMPEVFTWRYDEVGRMKDLQRPNGVTTSYAYDAANRLQRLTHTNALGITLEDFQYTYSPESDIETISSLASANLLPMTKTANLADAANRIPQFGHISSSYDEEGQTTTKTDTNGTASYEWDARGRLVKVILPNGHVVSYGYDALGRRISRKVAESKMSFLYDGVDVVLDRTSSSSVDYLNGLGVDQKLRQSNAGIGSIYYLSDYLSSTTALTGETGSLVEKTLYEAFGAGISLTRYGFTGRELDEATGLMYYRTRWYDTQQGRFLTEDFIAFMGGINFYSYVHNNSINFIDPYGLQEKPKYTPDHIGAGEAQRKGATDISPKWVDGKFRPTPGGYPGAVGELLDHDRDHFEQAFCSSFGGCSPPPTSSPTPTPFTSPTPYPSPEPSPSPSPSAPPKLDECNKPSLNKHGWPIVPIIP